MHRAQAGADIKLKIYGAEHHDNNHNINGMSDNSAINYKFMKKVSEQD